MANEIKAPGPVAQVRNILSNESTKRKFGEVLGNKAELFTTSIINAVSSSDQLKKCTPNSIVAAALVAATYDLPIDSNLGFAALVPYTCNKMVDGEWVKETVAQYQMMYKGFVQLAIRSGQFKKMNVAEVYQDELKSYNPITGECEFVSDFSNCKQREDGETDKIIGYFARFELVEGYIKELYMSKKEIENHARQYSKSYQYDINKNKETSLWSTAFDTMAKKTVLKMLLSKWAPLSIEMQKAMVDDQKVFDEQGNDSYKDNEPDVVEDVAIDPFEGKNNATEEEVVDIDIV